MEDVVLHYQPGPAAGLSSLLETTEKILQPFPPRTPPVFIPWFPAAADHHRPIRPTRPAPIITVPESRPHSHTAPNKLQKPGGYGRVPERSHVCPQTERTRTPHENPIEPTDGVCVLETPKGLLPASSFSKEREMVKSSPEKQRDGFLFTDSPLKRSWSVFTQRRRLLQSSQSLSQHFHRMVSIHRLHLRQRVKWLISQHNCGATRDIEQVWQAVSRSIRGSRLPTCNANIQRERAEIWVFCDVLHSEQVGHFLKDELQLSGRISLSAPRLGNIFSM